MERWLLAAVLVVFACGDEATVGSSTTAADTSELSSSATALDVGVEDPWPNLPAPDCGELVLPGDATDVAMTPRGDRSAELLALRASGGAFVARQADYEVIADDLTAIRDLAPELAMIDIGCEAPTSYMFTAGSEDFPVVDAVWQWTFHAWDCHNAFYGIEHRPAGEGGDVGRVDGLAFIVVVAGVYDSTQFIETYGAIVGLEAMQIDEAWGFGDGPASCERNAGKIVLATDGESTALGVRTYTFVHPRLGERVFTVAPGESPVES